MPGVTKVHPVAVAEDFEQVGKKITWFNVSTVGVNVNASTGPEGAIAAIYSAIQQIGTIVAAGNFTDATPSVGSFGVEGEVATADIQTAIQALGTVDTLDLSSSTVASKTLALA